MDSILCGVIDKLNNVICNKNCNKIDFDFINSKLLEKFYFENLNDDEFFTRIGAKNTLLDFYSVIAKTGVKTIILGGVWIGLKKNNSKNLSKLNCDNQLMKSYRDVVKVIHRNNAKAFLRLIPGYGREIKNNLEFDIFQTTTGYKRGVFDSRLISLRASDGKIYNLINETINTVKLAELVGFDGIVIDATFANLFGELSSKEMNKRVFGYFSNHLELLTKIINQIKKKCKKLKIIVKLSVFSLIFAVFSKNKQIKTLSTIKTNIEFKDRLEDILSLAKCGVDGFEFEFGTYENEFIRTMGPFIPTDIFDEIYVQIREYLKNNIKERTIELFYNNPTFDLSGANNTFLFDNINFINATKYILADKYFIHNLKNGHNPKICIGCNYCDMQARENQEVKCSINPGLRTSNDFITIKQGRKVAVIGSGVAGLVCATTLAGRGFVVNLYEKNNNLNNNGKICSVYYFDELLNKYYLWLESEVNNYIKDGKIILNLNTEVIAKSFSKEKYDAIVIATGFKQKNLLANGAVHLHVKSIYDVLSDKNLISKKKNIVLNGKTELSFKLTLYLLINGYSVSLLISNLDLLKKINHSNLTYYLYQIERLGGMVYLETKIRKINEDNVDLFVNKNLMGDYVSYIYNILSCRNYSFIGQAVNIDCDLFIYEPDIIPNNKLYYDFVSSGYKGELFLIGQALENGDLANDIESGYYVGKNI